MFKSIFAAWGELKKVFGGRNIKSLFQVVLHETPQLLWIIRISVAGPKSGSPLDPDPNPNHRLSRMEPDPNHNQSWILMAVITGNVSGYLALYISSTEPDPNHPWILIRIFMTVWSGWNRNPITVRAGSLSLPETCPDYLYHRLILIRITNGSEFWSPWELVADP